MSGKPIGIIGAMSVEIRALLAVSEIEATEEHASMQFHIGALSGVPCVIVQCGEGKVNAAVCAQALADCYHPRAILNIGVAGGVGKGVHIGDVVIADACVQHDADSSPLGWKPGEVLLPSDGGAVTRFPCDPALSAVLKQGAEGLYGRVHTGVVASGDQFIASAQTGLRLQEQFGAVACEMEGAAIAHACLLNGIPCAVLRSISDNANKSGSVDFQTFAEESARKVQQLLAEVITAL